MSEDTFRWVITGAVGISTLCILIMAATAFVLYRVIAKLQVKAVGVMERGGTAGRYGRRNSWRRELAERSPTLRRGLKRSPTNAKNISDVAKDQAHRFAEMGRDALRTVLKCTGGSGGCGCRWNTVEQAQHAG